MAHQADYTSAHSCMLPSQIDKSIVNPRGCHLYLQKPYVPFPDCLSLGLFSCGLSLSLSFSHPPSHSKCLSFFPLSVYTRINHLSPSSLSLHPTLRVSLFSPSEEWWVPFPVSAPRLIAKAHCFAPASPAITLFCLVFCAQQGD